MLLPALIRPPVNGSDLLITGPDGSQYLVIGYFNSAVLPTLQAPNGTFLEGDLVAKLAGPRVIGDFAQAGNAPLAEPIGEVVKAEGGVGVQRAATGQTSTLSVGDPVFTNDVVETQGDGKVGISFLDETILTINANSQRLRIRSTFHPAQRSLPRGRSHKICS